MNFRMQKLELVVSYAPCNWRSAKCNFIAWHHYILGIMLLYIHLHISSFTCTLFLLAPDFFPGLSFLLDVHFFFKVLLSESALINCFCLKYLHPHSWKLNLIRTKNKLLIFKVIILLYTSFHCCFKIKLVLV